MIGRILFAAVYIVLTFGCAQQNVTRINSDRDAFQISPAAVNINTATTEELEKIPHIGGVTAREIVEHRRIHGPFRKPEHLMLLPGISGKRFREMRNLIRTE